MRKRGRPKVYESFTNARAPEKEYIDLLQEEGLISDLEHATATHYRWVYTVRFGLPFASSVDLSEVKGRSVENNDSKHNYAAKYYKYIASRLAESGMHSVITNACVYNTKCDLKELKAGLELLVEYSEVFAKGRRNGY